MALRPRRAGRGHWRQPRRGCAGAAGPCGPRGQLGRGGVAEVPDEEGGAAVAAAVEEILGGAGPTVFTSLYLLRELGSMEAYRDHVRGNPLEATAPVLAATVGSRERVASSFASVRIAPIEEAGEWFELDELPGLAPDVSTGPVP